MKNVAVFFNSPYLGGAERSLVHQLSPLKEKYNVKCYCPLLDGGNESLHLKNLCQKHLASIESIYYSKALFAQSRYGKLGKIIDSFVGMCETLLNFRSININEFDTLYINGNKVGVPLYIFCLLTGFHGNVIWHFRDYPSRGKIFNLIWKMFKLKTKFNLTLLGNSQSVANSLKNLPGNRAKVDFVYNPVGLPFKEIKTPSNEFNLGIVSMLAPWKGIHQVLTMISQYKLELRKIGMKKLLIYGGGIYKTSGAHQDYSNQLHDLCEKLDIVDEVRFCGLGDPREIFENIDILVHCSIYPEPFGRVIVEGFSQGIPVLSCALGGSKELFEGELSAFIFHPYDYTGLYRLLQFVRKSHEHTKALLNSAQERVKMIDEGVKCKMLEIMD